MSGRQRLCRARGASGHLVCSLPSGHPGAHADVKLAGTITFPAVQRGRVAFLSRVLAALRDRRDDGWPDVPDTDWPVKP